MTTNTDRASATIYQFPARDRFAANTVRDDSKPIANMMSPHAGKVAVGGGWYHEEAIQEAERTRTK